MTYQIIYSSRSTKPMQSDDLEMILERARAKNGAHGISGALVYADGTFLQILEGERATLQALMIELRQDRRHENVTLLREDEMPSARFSSWGMAYVGATAEQVARWAGVDNVSNGEDATSDVDEQRRTAQFAQDILALLTSEKSSAPVEDGREPRVAE